MFCSKCGQKLEEDSKFCIKCGTAVNTSPVTNVPPPAETFIGVTPEQTQKNEVCEASSQKSEPEAQTDKKQDNFVKYIYIITVILFVLALVLHSDIIGIIAVVAIIASMVISIVLTMKKAKKEAATAKKVKVDTTICPKCKEPIGKNNAFCEKCGAAINNPKRDIIFWLTFILVFGICSAITIINEWSSLIFFIDIIPALIFAGISVLITEKYYAKRK